MKNKTQYILAVLLTALLIFAVFILTKHPPSEINQPDNPPDFKTGLKICPDEWIDNQMPGDSSDKLQRQYFIMNGERRELEEFDVLWVQKNCNLTKQVVY